MLKVLHLDIETAPKKAFVWGVWKQNVGHNQMISDWHMISWSAKWDGAEEVFGDVVSREEILEEDDSRIMNSLWYMLDAADVVVGHNGDKFDIPSINTRFIINGMTPPSPYRQVDTLKIAKRKFKFTRNNLDALGDFLGVGRKIDTGGFELWSRCVAGDEEALEEMYSYNRQDVVLLEEVYHKLLPYALPHPSHGVVNPSGKHVCPRCSSENVQKRGYYHTNVSTFQRYKCTDCGSWSRARKNVRTKEEMSTTLLAV